MNYYKVCRTVPVTVYTMFVLEEKRPPKGGTGEKLLLEHGGETMAGDSQPLSCEPGTGVHERQESCSLKEDFSQ